MAIGTYLPRPEYPRPDRQRGFVHGVDWLNLNGAWEFRFDPDRLGMDEQWFRAGRPALGRADHGAVLLGIARRLGRGGCRRERQLLLPRVYRNPLEVDRFNYRDAARHEVGWYRRTFMVPATERGAASASSSPSARRISSLIAGATAHTSGETKAATSRSSSISPTRSSSADGELVATLVFRVEDPHGEPGTAGRQTMGLVLERERHLADGVSRAARRDRDRAISRSRLISTPVRRSSGCSRTGGLQLRRRSHRAGRAPLLRHVRRHRSAGTRHAFIAGPDVLGSDRTASVSRAVHARQRSGCRCGAWLFRSAQPRDEAGRRRRRAGRALR